MAERKKNMEGENEGPSQKDMGIDPEEKIEEKTFEDKNVEDEEKTEERKLNAKENLERSIEETEEAIKELEIRIKLLEAGKADLEEKIKTYIAEAENAFQKIEDKGLKITYKFQLTSAFENLKKTKESAEKGIQELSEGKEKLEKDIEMMKSLFK